MLLLNKTLPSSELRRWIIVMGHRDVCSTLASPADLLYGLGQTAPPSVFPPSFVGAGDGYRPFCNQMGASCLVSWPKMAWPRWCGAKSEVTYLGPQKHSPAPTLGFVRQSETTLSNASAARGAGRAQVQVDTSIDWKHLLTCVFCSVSVEQAAQREL